MGSPGWGWGNTNDEEDDGDGLAASLVYGSKGDGLEAQSAAKPIALAGAQPAQGRYSTGEGADTSGSTPAGKTGSGTAMPNSTSGQPTVGPPVRVGMGSGTVFKPTSPDGRPINSVSDVSPAPALPDQRLPQEQQLEQQVTKFNTPINRQDPSVKPRWYEQLQGRLAAGLIGVKNPELGIQAGSNVINRRYNQAEQARQQNLGNAQQQMQDFRANRQDTNQDFERQLQLHNTGINDLNTQSRITNDREKNTLKRSDITQKAAKAGLKPTLDENGEISGFEDDQNSEVFKSRQVMDDLRGAQREAAEANAALKQAQNDPTSPAFKLAKQRAETANGNMAAAQSRAKAYMLNATGANLGTDAQGNALPGSTVNAEGTPVGSRFQTSYDKNQGRVAQFNDVLGATDNLEKTARTLVQKHGKGALSDSVIAAGLSEPDGTFGKWLQGQVANGNMTGEQRDYVTNLRAFRENLQALRKSAGGGVSDSQVNRLMEMAPGASTPDLDYLMRQTKQIRQTAGRLSEGIPSVTGGRAVRTGTNVSDAPQSPKGGPAIGTVEGGYRFKGGDPKKQENWEPVRK